MCTCAHECNRFMRLNVPYRPKLAEKVKELVRSDVVAGPS